MAWPGESFRMPSNAITGELIPEVYSARVINHIRENLVCVNVCDTTWKAQMARGDKIWIPIMTTIGATDVDPRVSFLAAAEVKAFSTGPTSITIDQWKENPIMIDDSTAAQTHIPGLLQTAASNAAYGLEEAIDTFAAAFFDDCTATWAGTDGQTFTDDLFIDLQEGLDEGAVPRRDRALVGDPSMVADIYKIDKFMSMDYSNRPFTTDGYVGTLPAYNVPVFVSNNLLNANVGHYGLLLHKECIGLILQSEPKVETWRQADQHADGINISAFYGGAVLRATFGAEFYTRKQ